MCMRHVRTCTCASIASLAQRKKTDGRIKLLGRCVTLRGRAPRPRLGPCVDAPQPIDRVTEGFAAECVLICTPCHDLGNFVAFVQLISASKRTDGWHIHMLIHLAAAVHVLAAIVSPYSAPRRSQATTRRPATSRPAVNAAAAGDEILQRLRINSTQCTLGLPLAHGAYGSVRWATVDGVTCIAKSARPGKIHADAFLTAEALINARLKTAAPEDDAHLAPFLGAASVAGSRYLVWRACPGVHGTLEDFLEPRLRLTKLGRALGITPSHAHGPTFHAVLARTLLRELLSTLVVVHGCGVASRDIKPANLLVDDECHGLRLIDFGAASIASASTDAGRPEQQSGGGPSRSSAQVGTAAYMPPEGAVMPAVPGAYDIYSASLVWLRAAVPSLAPRAALEEFRQALHRFGVEGDGVVATGGAADAARQRLEAWLLPWLVEADVRGRGAGWDAAEARRAASLLARMLAARPEQRGSAAEALAHPYLSA